MEMLIDFDPRVIGQWLKSTAKTAMCTTLAVLPLCGLVLFFEVSSATAPSNGFLSHHLRSAFWRAGFSGSFETNPSRVDASAVVPARFTGISAQLARTVDNRVSLAAITANEAEQAFFDAPSGMLKVGHEAEFITKDGRRLVLRIVSRQPIADQAMPDNARIMNIAPASTATVINFAWGQWLYGVEIEDRGLERGIAVQKSL
jgi:hypothetical protein